ncbi:MAG: DUF5647 family protein [Thermodesulfobacteriota bacterium]
MEDWTPEQVADKVMELTEQFNQYVFDNPGIVDSIPDRAILVFLDADDPEFNRANMEMIQAMPRPTDGPLVYVRMRKHVRIVQQVEWMPEVMESPLPS